MLAIRMQRLGRKGHPTYRVVVQDSRQTPTSGKYVAMLGSYDPHLKTNTLVKDKAQFYLDHGAQPSDRVVKLFASEGIKLPKWVNEPTKQERTTRNPEKLRKNQPEKPAEPVEAEASEAQSSTSAEDDSAVAPAETQAEDAKTEETEITAEDTTAEETPAPEEVKTDDVAEAKEEASEAKSNEADVEDGKTA